MHAATVIILPVAWLQCGLRRAINQVCALAFDYAVQAPTASVRYGAAYGNALYVIALDPQLLDELVQGNLRCHTRSMDIATTKVGRKRSSCITAHGQQQPLGSTKASPTNMQRACASTHNFKSSMTCASVQPPWPAALGRVRHGRPARRAARGAGQGARGAQGRGAAPGARGPPGGSHRVAALPGRVRP